MLFYLLSIFVITIILYISLDIINRQRRRIIRKIRKIKKIYNKICNCVLYSIIIVIVIKIFIF